ncbi:MAG: FkbM family methyltransferase [Lachnospiraceae bacterium]|nr:FkbM family methyltransferase [Lachnospiraceae bacterium]
MEKILIWGTGKISEQALEQCDVFSLYDVLGFIDNDVNKIGTYFYNREIFASSILGVIQPDKIVILTASYEEIKRQIEREFPPMVNIVESMSFFYKQSLIKRYQDSRDPEIIQILNYLQTNDLQTFNYDFTEKYRNLEIEIQFDENCSMYFVYHNGKRLYFSKSLKSRERAAEYYRSILIEQDAGSPHKYTDENFGVEDGDVVVDIGVAEGNFSLQIVDRVSKLYIIESDDEWIEALRETFRNYGDKVIIIKKFITSINLGKYATLDQLIEEPVNFIKMDIEGNEWDALLGAEKLIARSNDLKCAICAYHGDFDEILIKNILMKYGMEISVTEGYMWFFGTVRQTYVSTRLCRGIVRGIKE